MPYRAPVAEMRFLLEQVLDAGRLAATDRFADATPDTIEAILGEAAKLAEGVLAPLRRSGDICTAMTVSESLNTREMLPVAIPSFRNVM